jgi:hypothetical protein
MHKKIKTQPADGLSKGFYRYVARLEGETPCEGEALIHIVETATNVCDVEVLLVQRRLQNALSEATRVLKNIEGHPWWLLELNLRFNHTHSQSDFCTRPKTSVP